MPFPPSLIARALALVWPAHCAACDQLIPEAALFCTPCGASLNPLVGACPGCALPWQPSEGSLQTRCPRCRRVPFPFRTAVAVLEYGEAIADAIVRTKHGRRRDLARRLARLMVAPLGETIRRCALGPEDLILPVPLHPQRLRQRGFNQALELARGALSGLRAGPLTHPRLERNLLLRTRPTRELGHAGPAARLAEVAGAFAVRDPARVRDRRVLLLDDVMTTGATFTECAEALRRAGAAEVHVLALARAV